MINNSFDEIWQAIMQAERIVIPLHLSPDADCIGSAIASALLLTKHGKQVTVTSEDTLPLFNNLNALYPIDIGPAGNIDYSKFDLILAQDLASDTRTSRSEGHSLLRGIKLINIDHHPTNTYYADLNYIDSGASSTAEILFELFKNVGEVIDKDIATALYHGLVSDSGWFAYGVHSRTYAIAGELVEYGVDSRKVKVDMSYTTLPEISLIGLVYQRAVIDEEYNFVFSYIMYDELEKLGLANDSFYDGKEMFKYLPNINFGCVITEKLPGHYSVSMRTREGFDFDVSLVAEALGGGGHKMAAGFKTDANSVEEVLEKIRNVVGKAR